MSSRTTRRDLLALAGASLATPALLAQQQENSSTASPELVVLNGRIITVDSRNPHAEAFAISAPAGTEKPGAQIRRFHSTKPSA
jgi:hypothetical protein